MLETTATIETKETSQATETTNVKTTVLRLIAQIFAVDETEVVENASLIEDLGGDSLDIFEAVFAIEDELYVTTEADSTEIKTVRDMLLLFGA